MADNTIPALEEIRVRQEVIFDDPAGRERPDLLLAIKAAREDVPRLLAVVDAVLKPHQPGRIIISGALCARHENHRYFSITQREAEDVIACAACPAAVYTSCTGCSAPTPYASCPVRQAITRELTGGEKAGG